MPALQREHCDAPRHMHLLTVVPFGPGCPGTQTEQCSGFEDVHSKSGSGSQSTSAVQMLLSKLPRFTSHCLCSHLYGNEQVLLPVQASAGEHAKTSGQKSRTIASPYVARSHRFGWHRFPSLARLYSLLPTSSILSQFNQYPGVERGSFSVSSSQTAPGGHGAQYSPTRPKYTVTRPEVVFVVDLQITDRSERLWEDAEPPRFAKCTVCKATVKDIFLGPTVCSGDTHETKGKPLLSAGFH